MRLLRRTSKTLETADVELAQARVWAEHGLLRTTDLCAIPGVGTLAASEVSELEEARKRGQAKSLRWAMVALGAVAGAVVCAQGDEALALAALLLLAVAQAALLTESEARRTPISGLPTSIAALRALLRRAHAHRFASSFHKAAGICAVAAVAAVPGTALSLGTALTGLLFVAAARLLRRL